MDASAAVERVRSRSVSRMGRKRTRSEAPRDMEVDGEEDGSQAPKKRVHSSKSRCPFTSSLYFMPCLLLY